MSKNQDNNQNNIQSVISYMLNKFPWVTPETIASTINHEHSIAKCYGMKEKGYARLSSINPLIFNSLFPDATLECFASPLNSHLRSFASIDHTDNVFGSVGDIFNYTFTESVICAHPPNEAPIIKSFLNHVYTQIKLNSIKLYLFVPDWLDLNDTIGDSLSYVIAKEHFSLQRLREEKILTNGNPLKYNIPWVPQQPRVLITFLFPSTVVNIPQPESIKIESEIIPVIHTYVPTVFVIDEVSLFQEHTANYSDFISAAPFVEVTTLTPSEQIHYYVDRLCGIGSPKLLQNGRSLHYKLVTEFSSKQLSLQGSRLSDYRAKLNELVLSAIPTFQDFCLSEPNEQEDIIQHAISIAAGYYEFDDSPILLKLLNTLYNDWCMSVVDESLVDNLILSWYMYVQKVITSWLIVVCPILESMPAYTTHYPVELEHYSTITFNGASDDILLNNSCCDMLTDHVIDGVYYCTNTLYDKINLDSIYSSYGHIFSNLVIMSFDQEVVFDLQSRYSTAVSTTSRFLDHPVYFSYLIVSNLYVDISHPVEYLDVDNFTHAILGSHYLGLSVESYSTLEVYKQMKDNRWLWKSNKLTPIFLGITKFALDAIANIDVSNLKGARSLFIMLQLIENSLVDIHTNLLFAIEHPLVRRCGGIGTDLYLNELPHNSKNLMFMVEYLATRPVWTATLEMNMLNRNSAVLGELVDIRVFSNQGEPSSIDSDVRARYTSRVVKYDWSYRKSVFHTQHLSESEKSVEAVYFYERYLHSLNKFIVLQVLELHTRSGTSHEYVHPHSMSELKNLDCSTFNEYDDINSFFSACNFNRDPYSYFPNVHIERRVNDSCLGVDPEPLVSVLNGKNEVVSYLEDLVGVNEEDMNEGNYSGSLLDGEFRSFGLVSHILDTKLRNTDVCGWVPKVVNVVPRYYFDIYRDLSNKEFTLMGDRIQYHTARIEIDEYTLFPCPGSNLVWNCKIGHILSGACVRSLRVKANSTVNNAPKPNYPHKRNHRSNRRK